MPQKYIVVLGLLLSGLGKGAVTSSIIKMLDFYDVKALPVKFDGYLNYDCGTMNPYRHGEVFVLDDKSEVDMDFGLYERFLNKNLTGDLSITGGKLFSKLINKERGGGFLGEDVQIIPHLTNEIIDNIESVYKKKSPDVLVIEVGGTVGDIENSYFIESMRQFATTHDVTFVCLTYVPALDVVGEQKTKPTQIGLRQLLQAGISPNVVICRSSAPLEKKARDKIALFSNLGAERVIDDSDDYTIYHLPQHFIEQGLDKVLLKDLRFDNKLNKQKLNEWATITKKIKEPKESVRIGIVGKYTGLKDSYASLREALIHSGAFNNARVNIEWIESTSLEDKNYPSRLKNLNGIIVPGGFGKRGTEGMINAIRYAREEKVPFLGLCLGMQMMTVEYARNVCGMKNANSSEMDPKTKYKVIDIIEWQKGIKKKGGTMRLGAYECILAKDTKSNTAYSSGKISERHRHRYEFNNKYRKAMEDAGLVIAGINRKDNLVEFIEWKESFGIGTQAHPELKSRLENPAPLFTAFIKAAHARSADK